MDLCHVTQCCRGRAPIYGASGWAYCTVTRLSTCSAIPWTSLSSTATRNEICPWEWYSTSLNSPIRGKLTLLLFFFFLAHQTKKKKNHYPGERNETNEIISNEWVGLLSRIKVCVLQLRYNGKGKILFKKTKLIPSCLFPMKILLSYDIVISYRDDLKIF